MHKVPFYFLPRPIQDRFIESTRGNGAPKPVLYQPPKANPWALGLAIAAAVLFALCGVIASRGYGNLEHRWALNPLWMILVYMGLLGMVTAALLKAVLIWNQDALLPYRRGIYAFPGVVVDARSETLQVHKTSELAELNVEGSQAILRFSDGASFAFHPVDVARKDEIQGIFSDAQERLSMPPSETSGRDQSLLDPLANTGFKSLFAPNESMKPGVITWSKYWPLIAIGAGVIAGVGLWKIRNVSSAKHLYVKARKLNTAHAYVAYLARGGARKDVGEILLPRAELRDAVVAGTPEAIESFMDAHPRTKITSEATVALYSALLDDLEKARAAGTLVALRDFRKGDARASLVESERAAAQRALFRAALNRFQTESLGSPELKAIFEKLLAYSQQHGPKVEIRFRRRVPESASKIEAQLQKSPYFGGSKALPIQFFDAGHSVPREQTVASTISERLSAVFPKDILSFELNPEPLTDDAAVPVVTTPTLLITHTTTMSAVYTSRKPRGAFAAMSFTFKAQLLLPGETAPPTFSSSAWMPPNLKKYEEEGLTPENLYESMAKEAFSQFLKKYLATLFHA
jgi:hypothetical protein